MAFNTYNEGLKIASNIANRAIAAESSLSTLSPLSSPLPSLHKAFQLYVSAAEAYSHLLSSSLVSKADRPLVSRKWRLVLERAEKVKRRIEELGGRVGAAEVDDAAEEAAVCRRAARMNGIIAEPWRGPPPDREFEARGGPFRDTMEPELADEQIALDPEWAELPASTWDEIPGWRVRQGPGADCSVTAGLGACFAHNQRWNASLGEDALYPQAVTGQPRRSENAKHVVKLLLNGMWRNVVVDALLPRSKRTGSPLHITVCPEEGGISTGPAWVPIAVKGYFKALGGYAIPGSNPAPDVYAFTGWIPEPLDLSHGFQREKEWARLFDAWSKGNVIVTVGSGKDADQYGLTPLHAYGVVDIREEGDERLLRVFDPGSGRRGSTGACELADAMEQVNLTGGKRHYCNSFTMTWDEVCTKFSQLHLNWNPALFPVTAVRHWSWPKAENLDNDTNDSLSLRASPRFRIVATPSQPNAEVWLLLSQHTTTKDRPQDDVCLHVFRDRRGGSATSRHSGRLLMRGYQDNNPYANALHSLVRFPLRDGENVLNTVASRDRGVSQTGFTLHAFASPGTTLSMTRVSLNLPFNETVSDALTKRSAGGHPGYPTHHLNPQYRLAVGHAAGGTGPSKKSTLRFALQGAKDLAWNVKLLWGQGARVFDLTSESVIVSSGPYSYGMAYCEIDDVEAGAYTVLVSAYDRDQLGSFSLAVESSTPVTITSIPQEGAGMFNRTVAGKWDERSAGGRPSGQQYGRNPHVDVVLSKPATIMGRLSLPTPVPVPINLTVFRRGAGDTLGEQVTTSGPYVERTSGVAITRTKVAAGVYTFVPSTYDTGVQADWVVDVWADAAFSAQLIGR